MLTSFYIEKELLGVEVMKGFPEIAGSLIRLLYDLGSSSFDSIIIIKL